MMPEPQMEWRRQLTVAGVTFEVSVTLPAPKLLPYDELARMEHMLGLAASGLAYRYAKQVATWGEQKVALMKLDERDAELLGIHKQWVLAHGRLADVKARHRKSAA